MSNKGKVLLKDKSERFSFRLDADTASMLHTMGTEQGLVPSEWMRQAIRGAWHARQVGLRLVKEGVKELIGAQDAGAVAGRAARHENK